MTNRQTSLELPATAAAAAEPKPARFRLFDDEAMADLRALWERKKAQRQWARDHPPRPYQLDNQPDEPAENQPPALTR